VVGTKKVINTAAMMPIVRGDQNPPFSVVELLGG